MTYHQIKYRAVNLRKEGYSYTHISKVTSVAKSTLSNWLADIPYLPNKTTLKTIGKARVASNLTKHKQKNDSILKAKKEARVEIGDLTNRDIFMLGLGWIMGDLPNGPNKFALFQLELALLKYNNCESVALNARLSNDACGIT